MGKAGQIAMNISTTFCSTGIPSVFLHPSEAQHGDLGIFQKNDLLLLIYAYYIQSCLWLIRNKDVYLISYASYRWKDTPSRRQGIPGQWELARGCWWAGCQEHSWILWWPCLLPAP